MSTLTDQQIRDAGLLFIPQQQYLASPFILPEEEQEQVNENMTVTNIPQASVGGGGGGGLTTLIPTFTSESAAPLQFTGDPTAQLTGRGRLDPMGSGFEETLESVTAQNTNPFLNRDALARKAFFEEVYQDPREISFLDKTKSGLESFGKTFKDTFFRPRVKGTLGDRLLKRATGTFAGIPTLANALGRFRNPFLPTSPTYNPMLVDQLNYLEGSNEFLIGRDPNTGALKYGPDSVLAGKNVISGFGTNNYQTALLNYIQKMRESRASEELKKEKIEKAEKELKNLIDTNVEKQRESNKARIERAYKEETGGKAGTYGTGESGRQFDDKGQEVDYVDPFDPGGGEKDGGFIDGTNRRKFRVGGVGGRAEEGPVDRPGGTSDTDKSPEATNRELGILSRGLGPRGTTGNITGFDPGPPDDRSTREQTARHMLNVDIARGLYNINKPNLVDRAFKNPLFRAGLYTYDPFGLGRKALQVFDIFDRTRDIFNIDPEEVIEETVEEDLEERTGNKKGGLAGILGY